MKFLLRNNKVAPVATFFVFLLHVVHIPVQSDWTWSGWIGLDKLIHFSLFAGLTMLWVVFPWKKEPSNRLLFAALIGFAISLEVIQSSLTQYRSGELLDLVYDAFAIMVVLGNRKAIIRFLV